MHALSYRLASIAELGRDAALERLAEEDTEYAAQHARLAELDGWAPGPELAAALVEVAADAPDCGSQLWLTTLWARVSAWVEAQAMQSLAGALAGGDTDSDRLVVTEAARDMRVSEYSVRSRAALVQQVVAGLPLSWEALDSGALTQDSNVSLVPTEHDTATIVATADAVTARAITDALDFRSRTAASRGRPTSGWTAAGACAGSLRVG
jgi:hypothetical protein